VILFRYISRELITTTAAASTVLLLIVTSTQFVRYLEKASSGALETGVLLIIMGLRLPGFLELILPLSFFLAVLLAYGRLYGDNEMAVLSSCGVSRMKLLRYTLAVASLVSVLVGWLVLFVSPYNASQVERIFYQQAQRTEIDSIAPASFLKFQGGQGVVFAEEVSGKKGDLRFNNVFVALASQDDFGPVVVYAPSGRPSLEDDGRKYLVLENGYRTQGVPGQLDFSQILFKRMGHHLAPSTSEQFEHSANAIATRELIGSDDPTMKSALHWRISLVILIPIISIMAFALSKTKPRQGRYSKIIPAVFIYVFYLSMLNTGRGWIEDGTLSTTVGLIPVHLAFAALAALLYWRSEKA